MGDDDFWGDDNDGWAVMNFGVWGGRCWLGIAPQGALSPGVVPASRVPMPGLVLTVAPGTVTGTQPNHLGSKGTTPGVGMESPWPGPMPGGISMSIPAPVVAPPRPHIPQCHHTHGGISMVTCALVSPHPWSPVPHPGTRGGIARRHVPHHCHTPHG